MRACEKISFLPAQGGGGNRGQERMPRRAYYGGALPGSTASGPVAARWLIGGLGAGYPFVTEA